MSLQDTAAQVLLSSGFLYLVGKHLVEFLGGEIDSVRFLYLHRAKQTHKETQTCIRTSGGIQKHESNFPIVGTLHTVDRSATVKADH
jgi:hypothetical protein